MQSYILRIARDEWEKQVFALKAYYAGVRRDWDIGSSIFLIKKTESGDAFIGYGNIKKITSLEEMDKREKDMCVNNNWNKKLSFGKLVRFEPPVPVKDTVVSKWGQKGALLHGAPISPSDMESIVKIAKTKIIL
ncbi:MAG: hypothetical protein QXU32_08910 [Nitrososphaerales archaeon]